MYFFSNSPVRWRFTKVVLPVPPSPTSTSLNVGMSGFSMAVELSSSALLVAESARRASESGKLKREWMRLEVRPMRMVLAGG